MIRESPSPVRPSISAVLPSLKVIERETRPPPKVAVTDSVMLKPVTDELLSKAGVNFVRSTASVTGSSISQAAGSAGGIANSRSVNTPVQRVGRVLENETVRGPKWSKRFCVSSRSYCHTCFIFDMSQTRTDLSPRDALASNVEPCQAMVSISFSCPLSIETLLFV